MSRRKAKLGLFAGGLLALQATAVDADPTASALNHGLSVEVDALNDVSTLSWWGVTGETYFIQVTPDLTAGWEYIDFIYPGADDELAHGFATNTDAFFYRLKYTDQPTNDPWNDDFDGDNIGNQDELNQGTDPFAFDDSNANGIPDDWESFWDDQFAVFPKPIEAQLTYGQSATKTLYLNNPVSPDADFTVTVTGNEAEFQGAYTWEDSITGSAAYNWTEISATGTLLPLVSEVDNDSEKITLTQFEFPHYGRKYSDIWVSSNGYLTLEQEYNDQSNETLPDTSFPDGLIAVFWDDLDTDDGNNGNDSGTIYYQEFADRLIVQYEAVTQDANAFTNTFQIVLHADGAIEFFYKELNGVLDTVTVGMHDFDQTQAVQVAYNEFYLQNLLAVRFTQGPAYFVDVSPLSGTAAQGGFSSLSVDFETFELEPGTYQADIEIAHTGTGTTPWTVPAILELTNPPSQIELTAPVDGFTMWGDENVNLAAIATEDDFGIDRVEFFSDENKQGEDLTGSYYSYYWQQPPPGVHSITARAVDRLDTVTISEPITVTVLEDTDLDRMEDGWETTHFLGLQEAPLGDFDQDGASNLHEYEAGTDPTDDTDTPVNIPSVIAFTSPADGATYLEGDDINFHTSFSDADFGAERMVFYADGVEFDTDNSVYYSAFGFWDDPAPGSYTVTAIATDRYGAESPVGTPITVTVLADSDGDRMPDLWETTTFGDLSQAASEDGDGDGFPNIIEYHHGSDGNDPASTPRFAAAQSADSPLADIGAVRYYRVDGVSNTSFEKSSIQTAINAADDFDIIEVLPGVYDESINLSDRIYLFSNAGARTTIIDGGARNDNVVYLATEAVIEGFTIRNGARSWDGGGLYITESTIYDQMRIVGCVIRDNSAGDQGGGVYVSNGRPTFVSCTIAGNRAASGGAVYNTSTSNIITLVNTLLWNPDAPEETAGQTTSIAWDHSLSRDTTSGNVLIDGVDQLTADPGLGYDYSLIAASPARDTGTTALHPALDLDGEALTDGLKDIGADEFNDTDADGLPDWVETLGATDAAADSDGDTLNNLAEYETHWTNPNDSDTDSDQLDDGAELTARTDALDPDTDGDTLPDGWEVNYGLDPLDGTTADGDPDGDTLLNSEEFALGTDPTSDDTDGDGLKDNIEGDIFASTDPSNFHYLDPTNPDTDGDGIDDGLDSADGDELSNLDELALGTDPNLADTDADGVNDSVEVALGTDPLTNDDFANQDSDNDGLSDLFEINYGTDPYDADTNDNGMNDGEELDNGGDPRVPGPPPDPLDPNDPPGPDPFPPPPPPIYPGNYDILVESKSISFPKYGHGTFQSTDPAKRYLTLSAQQSFSGGCPESGPKNTSGSKTIEIDPITGESTTTGDGFVSTGGTAESPVRKSGESETSSYDDPPNEETDCEGTIHYSSVLSNENTTTMMVTNGKSELEDYEDDFSTWSATPSAYRNVHENELRYDYKKVQFKFKWEVDTEQEEKFPIRYYVLFVPEDDPDTAENEEETGMEIVDTIEWDGAGDESPVFEIDPDSLKSGEDGRYRLLEVDVRVPKIKWANDKNEVQADEFVSESILRDEGAFVPLNDDDDNYSGTADMDDMGEGSELVAIEGPEGELAETDLLPLIIKPIDGLADSGAKFLLNIPSGIRIWHEENRSDRVRGKNDPGDGEPTKIDVAEETTLYIEGVQQGEVELKFDLKFAEQTFEDVYTLKVMVFEIQGPTSVPALGTYEYRIEGASGEWKAPHRGTLFEAEDEAENKREIEWEHDFEWNGKTGAVIYAPFEGLEWGREVDIFELRLAANASEGENEVRAKNPGTGWEVTGIGWDGNAPGNNDTAVIQSGGGPNSLRGWVQVKSLRGPTRGGVEHRGVDRLKYGFVQKAKWEKKRSIYPGGVERVSSLEGMGWHLDRFLEPDNKPWIEDETYDLANSGLNDRRSFFQHEENAELTDGQLVFHYEFRRGSSLANSGVRKGIMISDQYELNSETPASFKVEAKFELYVAVTTDSEDEKADERYYRLANQPQIWRFTAFGRILNGNEIHTPNVTIDGRAPGDLWGAYGVALFVVRNTGDFGKLQIISGADEEHFIAQEYPDLLGGAAAHEQWANE